MLLEKGLPILQDIETREVVLLEDPSWSGHGTKVWNYKNLLLQEHYEYYQEGVVRGEAMEMAGIQPVASRIEIQYYKTRFPSMAEPLYRELMEKHREENIGSSEFAVIPNTAFDSCAISRDEERQRLVAVKGKQVISVEYSGGKLLAEEIGKLEVVID